MKFVLLLALCLPCLTLWPGTAGIVDCYVKFEEGLGQGLMGDSFKVPTTCGKDIQPQADAVIVKVLYLLEHITQLNEAGMQALNDTMKALEAQMNLKCNMQQIVDEELKYCKEDGSKCTMAKIIGRFVWHSGTIIDLLESIEEYLKFTNYAQLEANLGKLGKIAGQVDKIAIGK